MTVQYRRRTALSGRRFCAGLDPDRWAPVGRRIVAPGCPVPRAGGALRAGRRAARGTTVAGPECDCCLRWSTLIGAPAARPVSPELAHDRGHHHRERRARVATIACRHLPVYISMCHAERTRRPWRYCWTSRGSKSRPRLSPSGRFAPLLLRWCSVSFVCGPSPPLCQGGRGGRPRTGQNGRALRRQ